MTKLKFKLLKTLYDSEDRKIKQVNLLNMKFDKYSKIENALNELEFAKYIKFDEIANEYALPIMGALKFESEQKTASKIINWVKCNILEIIAIIISIIALLKK